MSEDATLSIDKEPDIFQKLGDKGIRDTLKEHPMIALWLIGLIGVSIVALFLRIPLPSAFAEHSPLAYLPLMVFIPLILLHTRESNDREILSLRPWQIIIVLGIGLVSLGPVNSDFVTGLLTFFSFLFLIPFVLAIMIFKTAVKNLGFRGNFRDVVYAIAFGLLYGMIVFFLVGFNELMSFFSDWISYWEMDAIYLVLPIAFLICLILIALPEEFFFRSIIQSGIEEKIGSTKGILLAALIFGFFHLPTNALTFMAFGYPVLESIRNAIVICFLAQAQIGIVLGVAWHRTRSLLLPVALHTMHNLVELLPFFMLVLLGLGPVM